MAVKREDLSRGIERRTDRDAVRLPGVDEGDGLPRALRNIGLIPADKRLDRWQARMRAAARAA